MGAVQLVRKCGVVVLVGLAGKAAIDVGVGTIVNRELTAVASRGKRHSQFEAALALHASGAVRLARSRRT